MSLSSCFLSSRREFFIWLYHANEFSYFVGETGLDMNMPFSWGVLQKITEKLELHFKKVLIHIYSDNVIPPQILLLATGVERVSLVFQGFCWETVYFVKVHGFMGH